MGVAKGKSCPCAQRRAKGPEPYARAEGHEDAWASMEESAHLLYRDGLMARIQEATAHARRAESVLGNLALRADLAQRHGQVRTVHQL